MNNRPKEEIDFNELVKDPKRLFGLSYVYFLLIGVVLGGYYVMNLNVITRNNVAPVVVQDSVSLVSDVPLVRSSVIPPVDVKIAGVPTKEAIAKGASLFRANCISCHGETGMGDGPTSVTLNPKPRNFHAALGWTNGRKIAQMFRTLQEGIVKNGMASYNYMPAEDRFALIHYVRTFANDFPVDSTSELMELETTYQLSKGSVTPAQIPVTLAVRNIIAEHHTGLAAMEARFAEAMKSAGRGPDILRSVVLNPRRAVSGLVSLQGRTPRETARAVAADPSGFGMKATAALLTADDWNAVNASLR
jgi:mono/diheme cytochrome c family protein